MEKFLTIRNPDPQLLLLSLIIIFIISFAVPCSCAGGDQDSTTDVDVFASCLIGHNVNNFSTYKYSADYFRILNFSIINLRFSEPSVPKPVAIILPRSKEEVVDSVYCTRQASWGIRVRCGGHSYEGTSSSVSSYDETPFVIIDLMNLNRVRVDLEAEFAWVEGGATLGQAYAAIAESSQVHGFSAGSCPTVGIGGHISGGGFGLLSRKYGLAADNVADALLIDADGRILDRQAMGEDVFWAIRGGGGGIWGIIYAWKIKLLKVPKIVTGFKVSRSGSKHEVAKLVHKWQHVAPNLADEFYLSTFVGASLPERKFTNTTGISVTFKGLFLGPRSEAISILDKVFPELEIVEKEDCQEMSWIESVVFFSGLENGSSLSELKDRYLHSKHYFKAKADYVRSPISYPGIMAALDMLEKEPKGYVILDPYGGVMERISSESIAFPHRKGNIFAIQYLVEWKERDNDDKGGKGYIDWIRGFYNSMTPHVSWGPRAAYINYVDLDLGAMAAAATLIDINGGSSAVEMARVWGEKYFLKNYDKLVRAKTLIDPYNIFSHQQGIPPLSYAAAMPGEQRFKASE